MTVRPRSSSLPSLLLSLVFAVMLPAEAQRLVSADKGLPGLWAGRAAWVDFDGDGDLDVALLGELAGGDGRPQPAFVLYLGQPGGMLQEAGGAAEQVVGAFHGDLAWADYDGDGDPDLAVAGWDAQLSPGLWLYRNQLRQPGERVLELDYRHVDGTGQSVLAGVRYAALAWGDHDGDGDLDLAVTGMEANGTSLSRIYTNNGGILRVDWGNSEAVVNLHNGAVAWADYDEDGDLDLAVSGENVTASGGLGPITEFYRNHPVGRLDLDQSVGVQAALKGGGLAWGDYDGDGHLDLAVSGRDHSWNPVVQLYRNWPVGALSLDSAFRPAASRRVDGSLAWADYDNDGDLDLAAAGRTAVSGAATVVFANEVGRLSGAGAESGLAGLAGGSVSWGDHDGDGDLDLLACGLDDGGSRHSLLYDNRGTAAPNQPPAPPQQLHPPRVTGSGVLLSWNPGSDAETRHLTYNVRLGTEEGGHDVVSGVRLPAPGNAGFATTLQVRRTLPPDVYYWNVQAVDDGLSASAWQAQDGVFTVRRFVSSEQRLRGVSEAAMAWGDYDADGDPDLLLAGLDRSGEAQSMLYVNRAGELQLDTASQLQGIRNGDAAWGDIDGDGDLDLALCGEDTYLQKRALLYRAEPGGDGLTLRQIGAFPGLGWSAVAWGDVDSDGDLDLAIMGLSDEVQGGRSQPYTLVFANEGGLHFVALPLALAGMYNGDLAWVDYDVDGDPDLAAVGKESDGSARFRLYRNDAGSLLEVATSIEGVDAGAMAWADYDGDGDPDLALAGMGRSGQVTRVYRNLGGGEFAADAGTVLPGVWGGDLAWGDYDNDQDVDLVLAGADAAGAPLLRVYENRDGTLVADDMPVLTGVDLSAVALADFDGDGDLDLFSAGRDASLMPQAIANENLEGQFNRNRAPAPPQLASAADSADTVLLTWSPASDEYDPDGASLTYNVRVGTEPGAGDVLSGAVPVGPGNSGHGLHRRLSGLTSGTYYWSVQTVDDGWARSAWAPARTFMVDTVAPVVADVTVSRTRLGIGQTVTVAIAFSDEHSGMDPAVPPQVELLLGGTAFPLAAIQYVGGSWSGALTVAAGMPSGTASLSVAGAADRKGNRMAEYAVPGVLAVDTEAPAVAATAPGAGASEVPVATSVVTVDFTEPLAATSVTAANFQLRLGSAVLPLLVDPSYDAAAQRVTLRPAAALKPGTEYTVFIGAPVQDLFDNTLGDARSWTFRTAVPELLQASPVGEVAAAPGPLQAVFSSAIDADALDEDAVEVRREGERVPVRAGSLRFAPTSCTLSFELEPGVQPGSRYQVRVAGQIGGPLRLQSAGDYGWSFQTAVPQLVRQEPLGLHTDLGQPVLAQFDGALDTAMVGTGSVRLYREGEGVALAAGYPHFDPGTNTLTAAPAGGWLPGSRYEVVLAGSLAGPRRVQSGGDFAWRFQTPVPELLATTPSAGADDLSGGGTTLLARFDQPLDVRSIGSGTVRVLAGGTEVAVGPPEYNSDTRTLRVDLERGLRAGTAYEVRLAAALGGPLRLGDYSWRFSTAAPRLTEVTPAAGAVGASVTMGAAVASFSVSLDPEAVVRENFVLLEEGVPVPLRDEDPLTLGGGRYAVAPAAGWRVGSRYTVRIAPVVCGPLGRDQDPAWSFSTAVPDTAAVAPAAGDDGVSPVDGQIRAVFTAPVDQAALRRPGGVVLSQEGRPVEVASVNYDPESYTVRVLPAAPLRAGSTYQVSIAAAVGGPLRQAQGPFTWGFSTLVPGVVATFPEADTQVGAGDRRVAVRFSAPVDLDLMSPESFALRRAGAAVELDPAGFDYDASTFTVEFPAVPLLPGSEYTATVLARVAGPLGASRPDYVWSFRTELPRVLSVWPLPDADGVPTTTTAVQLAFSQRPARQDAGVFQMLARALADTAGAYQVVELTPPSVRDSTGAVILSFSPRAGFRPFTAYRVSVGREALGEIAVEGYSWEFSTAARLADVAAGGTVRNASGSVELYFPPNALPAGTGEVAIRHLGGLAPPDPPAGSGLTRVTEAYAVAAGDPVLRKPVSLVMRYAPAELGGRDASWLGVFRWTEEAGWDRVGGAPVAGEPAVRTAIDELGVFALFADSATPVGKLAIRALDCQPRAFAPSGRTGRAQTDISFELTGAADVTVRVYDAAGCLARVIARALPLAPGRVSVQWDGRGADGDPVPSGLYIVVVEGGGVRSQKTVAVIR